MFVSNLCVRTRRILAQIDWKEVGLIVFHGLIALMVGTYVAGETLGNWVHRTNNILAANWVRLLGRSPIPVMEEEENEEADEVPLPIVPSTPAEVEQAPVIPEEVSVPTTPAIKVEPLLPPVAEVVEILELDEQPPPTARRPRGRRAHAQRKKTVA